MEVRERFGDLLRRHRALAGLSQQGLAARTGLSTHAIGLLERGERSAPRNSTVMRLANALRLRGHERDAFFAAARPSSVRPAAPHELPCPPADFTGRASELAGLLEVLGDGTGSVVITAIDGMGGVGKSALAVHAAHRLAGAFPDGQLYIDLQGSTPGLPPLEPLDALGHLLRSLGLDPRAVPGEAEEAAARFRSLAAGRRLLLVLDNARGAEQVRPLLPGGPSCGVLITSRQVLGTLEGGRALHLDVLPEGPALELLGRVAGAGRVAAEPRDAAEVVRCCAGLPLAIRIAGARLAARSGWPVRELAGQLADAGRRLEALEAGELAVRASFDVSLAALEESSDPIDRSAASAFGLLSLPDGPDLGVATAARILDRPVGAARTALERLVDAQLLESQRPGRYRFHDLVRLHARERAERLYGELERTTALVRGIGFYIATSWQTLARLRPGDWRLQTADPRWVGGGLRFDDELAALDWLDTERANLLAAITQAAEASGIGPAAVPPELPGQLTSALFGFFFGRSHWRDWTRAGEAVLAISRRVGDRSAQSRAQNDLGLAFARQGRYAEAVVCLRESLAIARELGDRRAESAALGNLGNSHLCLGQYSEAMGCRREQLAIARALGDRPGQAIGLNNLSLVHLHMGRPAEAMRCQRESLLVYRELGDRQGEARCLNNLGLACAHAGRHAEAVAHAQASLAITSELGYRHGRANGLHVLGIAHERQGRLAEAIDCQKESLVIFRDLGDRPGQAEALRDLGDACRGLGRARDARLAWQEALEIADELRMPEADEIRARLTALGN